MAAQASRCAAALCAAEGPPGTCISVRRGTAAADFSFRLLPTTQEARLRRAGGLAEGTSAQGGAMPAISLYGRRWHFSSGEKTVCG